MKVKITRTECWYHDQIAWQYTWFLILCRVRASVRLPLLNSAFLCFPKMDSDRVCRGLSIPVESLINELFDLHIQACVDFSFTVRTNSTRRLGYGLSSCFSHSPALRFSVCWNSIVPYLPRILAKTEKVMERLRSGLHESTCFFLLHFWSASKFKAFDFCHLLLLIKMQFFNNGFDQTSPRVIVI